MSVKYQVFISSTFGDLELERGQVIKAVLEMGHIPVGMEMFSAADDEQWSVIARQIDEADYYAVIVAHRYGSVTPTGISYTEKEYDYAVASGVPVLGFVLDDKAPWPADKNEKNEVMRSAAERFREKIKSRLVNFWTTKDDLHAKFSIALMKAFITHPRTGWAKADEAAGPAVTRELTRLSAENAELRNKIEQIRIIEKNQQRDAHRDVFRILEKNKVITHVRKNENDWGPKLKHTLLEIFEGISPNLIVENNTKAIAGDIAFHVTQETDYYHTWPVPSNHIADILVDLHALNLIEPSCKRHPVSDTKEYWALTEFGRGFFKELRRIRLDTSTNNSPERPTEPQSVG
ncbi:MAG: DUF4062 domain-containing protein [Moraxellaceae bacterium]|nr:DUF4062 domain-containing protein [Moraxellaceae bacterium]